jgi:N4-gp56 family major capsid protein
MNINVSTQIDPAVATYYDRVLLRRGLPFKNHTLFAQRRPIKKRSGNQAKFRRYGSLAVATTPLTEGVTPSGKTVTKTDITATIKAYGDYIHYSDVVSLTNQDPVLTEFTELLGEQGGETMDILARDVYVAGTNVKLRAA